MSAVRYVIGRPYSAGRYGYIPFFVHRHIPSTRTGFSSDGARGLSLTLVTFWGSYHFVVGFLQCSLCGFNVSWLGSFWILSIGNGGAYYGSRPPTSPNQAGTPTHPPQPIFGARSQNFSTESMCIPVIFSGNPCQALYAVDFPICCDA